MYPWWEIPRIDDFCTGSFKKVFTIDYKNGFSRRGKCCLTQRETVTSSHVREKTKKCQNCERLSRKTGFTHRKWGSLPVAKIKQRLHYCPVGLQLFYCAPILGQETLRNKILDRLSWQKNRLGKIQSTMKRKSSSWEILSGVPSNLWKSFSLWKHWWFVFFYQRFRNYKLLLHLTHVTARDFRRRQCLW